jgi:heme exporter protein A
MTFAARALSCRRGERLLFRDLSFDLAPGEALVLRGRNGAGKSSLLKLAGCFLGPTAGGLFWQGQNIADDPEAHRCNLNYVGHLDAVKPALSVAENLADWHAILAAGTGAGRDNSIQQALAAFGATHLADAPVRYLSAGQRKRAALARLLLRPAPLWLLDEATVSLDDDGIERLGQVIESHRAGGGMVIMATHVDLPLAAVRTLLIEAPEIEQISDPVIDGGDADGGDGEAGWH